MFGLVGRARGFFDRLDFFFFLKLKNNLPRTSMGQQLSESWEAGGPQGRQGKADPGSQACLPPQPGSRAVGRTRGSPSPGDKNGLRSGRDVGLWKGSARGGGAWQWGTGDRLWCGITEAGAHGPGGLTWVPGQHGGTGQGQSGPTVAQL